MPSDENVNRYGSIADQWVRPVGGDATLTSLRGLKPEEAQGKNLDKIRGELKEKLEKLGAEVERVLITDFVVQ